MNLPKPDLWTTWRGLALRYTGDESLVAGLYNELTSHYQEPHRYYHNLDHIVALLQHYFRYETVFRQPEVVLFSIFYHDVVYTPDRSDNEYQSVLLAQKALRQLGTPAAIIREVKEYIMATNSHTLAPNADHDLKLFMDLDLGILSAGRESYLTYLQNVRKEYGHLSEEQFVQGRRVFLQQMLHQEQIYSTEEFRDKEEAARKNMLWEMQMSPGIYSAR